MDRPGLEKPGSAGIEGTRTPVEVNGGTRLPSIPARSNLDGSSTVVAIRNGTFGCWSEINAGETETSAEKLATGTRRPHLRIPAAANGLSGGIPDSQ